MEKPTKKELLSDTYTLDAKKLKALRKAYETAVKNNEDCFLFEGRELVTMFAKYLIEYGEKTLGGKKKR